MDFDELLESIAEKAPSLQVNDTVHAGPGVWWKVVGDEKTHDRQMVESDLLHVTSTTAAIWNAVEFWYGTVLSVCGLLTGVLVVLGLLYRRSAVGRRLPLLVFTPRRSTRKWFIVNLVVIQLITAITIIATPATVQSHDEEPGMPSPSTTWKLGPRACRAWLLGRMWLSAATMWASFAALFDRFLSAVAPDPYSRLVGTETSDLTCKGTGGCSDGGRAAVVIGLGVIATWLAAATVLVPTWLSIDRSDFILEEVCAINLSSVNALYVTMSSYVVPSCLVIVVSLALVIARRRITNISNDADNTCADNYTRLSEGFAGCQATDFHDYDVIPDCANGHRYNTGCGATCATSWLCVLGWLPFHSLGVAVALCGILSNGIAVNHEDGSSPPSTSHQVVVSTETPMCVDPGVWTLFNWIGHTATVGLVPLVWLIGDRTVRTNVVRLFTPSCCNSQSEAGSSVGGRSTASSTCATDLSSAGSRRRLDDGSTL